MSPFIAQPLPLKKIAWPDLITSIVKANSAIARYDGQLQGIPNPSVLLSPLMTQEAVLSSKIEGTQATLEEVLKFEADPKKITEKYEDIEEIINYRKSLSFAEGYLQNRPVCLNLIRDMHRVLLNGVQGQNRGRGEFRRIQNWIGKPNTPIEQATYIPPPPNQVLECLSNWEKYYHYEEKDALIQLAILHAQFELIHPFLDGNGRIGRILIPLFLFDKKTLSSPMFYISAYFESSRNEYYSSLLAISEDDNWTGWIKYFLKAVTEQAKDNGQKAKDIMSLYDAMKERITDLTHSRFSIQTLDVLFHRPIFNSSYFARHSQIPKPSAARILKVLSENGIVRLIAPAKGQKPGLYIFPELLRIVQP